MCLGVPMQVLAVADTHARCRGRDGEQSIDIRLVGEVLPGQWLLTFLGVARALLEEEDAARSQAALAALDAVMAGETDVSAYFADLIGREPELPEFLRRTGHE